MSFETNRTNQTFSDLGIIIKERDKCHCATCMFCPMHFSGVTIKLGLKTQNRRSPSIRSLKTGKHSVSFFRPWSAELYVEPFPRAQLDGRWWENKWKWKENEEVHIKHSLISALWTHSHFPVDSTAADTQIFPSQQFSVVDFLSNLSLVGGSVTHCVNPWTEMVL